MEEAVSYCFEEMSEQHRHAVGDIFDYFIAHSFAAYPANPVGGDIYDLFSEMARGYPSVVVKKDDVQVVGFAFLHPYHSADTFRRTAEITYFIMPEHTGKGLGTAILNRFVQEARDMGIDTVLANISSRNEGSLRFHKRHGFHECGRFCNVGRKFGEDFDVIWMQLSLSESGLARENA